MRVLVFGDSISYGKWDSQGGWTQRLREHYDAMAIKESSRDYPSIYNLGISGDTTAELLLRFQNETKARISKSEEITFIFAIGINDSITEGRAKNRSTPDIYRTEIESLIAKAREFSNRILFVGLSPVDEKFTTPVSWRDVHYTNERIFLFENVMRDECLKYKIPHVPVLELLQDRMINGEQLMADGLHPNNKGNELIFEMVRPILDKLLAG